MTSWILCTARRTVTGILPFADPMGKHAHDAYHRFFPDARYNTATVTGVDAVGGLVGENSGSIAASYSNGSVKRPLASRWACGGNGGNVAQCYGAGTVGGEQDVGGLVGHNGGEVIDCYSTGAVSGRWYVGGLVGAIYYSTVTASFWNIQTSGQATSRGGTAKTTTEMQTAGTFLETGWDFVGETANGTDDIWWILEGQDYPRLWWEMIPEN